MAKYTRPWITFSGEDFKWKSLVTELVIPWEDESGQIVYKSGSSTVQVDQGIDDLTLVTVFAGDDVVSEFEIYPQIPDKVLRAVSRKMEPPPKSYCVGGVCYVKPKDRPRSSPSPSVYDGSPLRVLGPASPSSLKLTPEKTPSSRRRRPVVR